MKPRSCDGFEKKTIFLGRYLSFSIFQISAVLFCLGMKQVYLNSTWSNPKLALKAPKQCEKMMLFLGLLSNALLGHEEWNEQDELDPGGGSFDSDSHGWIAMLLDVSDVTNLPMTLLRMDHQASVSIYSSINVDNRTPALSSKSYV